jgi:transposase
MLQPHPSFKYISPISCPCCGASAHLIRRSPYAGLNAEIRTFECKDCHKQTGMTVRD